MKFKIKYADKIVGITTIFAILILIVLLFSIGSKQEWFSKNYKFKTRFETAVNLSVGMSIQYKGFSVGKIIDFYLTDDNLVDTEIQIYGKYYRLLKKGTILELSASPIGLGSSLSLLPGNGETLIEENAFIPQKDSKEAKELIARGEVTVEESEDAITGIVGEVQTLLSQLNVTLGEVNSALSGETKNPIGKSLNDLATITNDATGIVSNINQLTSELKDPTGLVPRVLESNGTVSHIFHDNNELYNQISSLLTDVSGTLNNVEGITASLNEETIPELPGMLSEVDILLLQLQDVLTGVKNNPLIKGGIPDRLEKDISTPRLRDADF